MPAAAYRIALGVTDLSSIPVANQRSVIGVFPYPYYNPDNLSGDASLLVLDSPAPTGAVPVAVATATDAALYAPGTQATIAGWGQTSAAPGSPTPAVLQTGVVAVQPNALCDAGPAPYHPGVDLCAAAAGFRPSICLGDSGGALVVATPAGPVEIGIVSYVVGSCGAGPDFYARASSVQPWIASLLAGTSPPPPFVPPFAAPAPTAVLNADGVTVSWAAPVADPATIPTGFVATLVNAAGTVVATQNLPLTATSATFPTLQPGSYAAAVVAVYTEGSSLGGITPGVTLAPPANTRKPSIAGHPIVGSMSCLTGAWAWGGTSTLATVWLRDGTATATTTQTYRVGAVDGGKKLSCRVTLTASSGSQDSASSKSVLAGVKVRVKAKPHIVGTAAPGNALACASGTWTHSGSLKLAYRWLRDGKLISGTLGRASRRVVTLADAGRRLACRVKAEATGQAVSATTPTVKVAAA